MEISIQKKMRFPLRFDAFGGFWIPYLKVLKNKKNHSSKRGSPASSFLTLFRGGP